MIADQWFDDQTFSDKVPDIAQMPQEVVIYKYALIFFNSKEAKHWFK